MTRKRIATCATPGCPELSWESYCPEHRRANDRAARERAPRGRKVYASRHWAGVRRLVLRRDPFCTCGTDCCSDGCQELSTVVDHIRDVEAGGAEYDPANLRGMAKRCHDRKTARSAWHIEATS